MKYVIQIIINSLFIVFISLQAYASEPEPATLWFDNQGFNVKAPRNAVMLEVRLMGPKRTLIFSELSKAKPIDWQISDAEIDGDYRYEVVVIMNIDGVPQQNNQSGGFEVRDGWVVAPPLPVAATDADIESLLDDYRSNIK